MKNKFCREILSLTLWALLFLQLPAQQKALKIGDAIPEEIWTTQLSMVNSPNKTTTLAKDRDKLILLDFWATWCGSCLKNFPKMEALQRQFGDRIKMIPVTDQNRPTIEKFFASKNGQRYKGISSVIEDKLFSELFPHRGMPYMVLIRNGKVLNTTDAEQVTAAKIQEILQDQSSSLQTILEINRDRPLLLADQFDLEKGTSLLNYALFSKGRIRSLTPGTTFRRAGGVTYGRLFGNAALLRIYEGIAYQLFEARGEKFSKKRLINLVKDSSPLDFSRTDTDEDRDKKSYSLEFIVPVANAHSLYPEMLKAVNVYSGYNATLEIQRVKCLVLKVGKGKLQKEVGKLPSVEMRPMESIIADLNDISFSELPVINESGFTGNVAIDVATITDLNSVKNSCNEAGFELIETDRDLLMFVLKDQVSNN